MSKGLRKPGEFCWMNILRPSPRGVHVLRRTARLDVQRHARHGPLYQGLRPRRRRPLRHQLAPDAPGHAAARRRHGQGRERRRCRHKSDIAGRQGHPPFDVWTRAAWPFARSSGAKFDVWGPSRTGNRRRSRPARRDRCVGEHPPDAARSTAFYSDLFGWTPEVMPMPDFNYTAFKLGSEYVAGMIRSSPTWVTSRPTGPPTSP